MKLGIAALLATLALPFQSYGAVIPNTSTIAISPAANVTGITTALNATSFVAGGNSSRIGNQRRDYYDEVCSLWVTWDTHWMDAAYVRYRVRIELYDKKQDEGSIIDKLDHFCWEYQHMWGQLQAPGLVNKKCWQAEKMMYIGDLSTFIGENGHSHYVDYVRTVAMKWRNDVGHGCEVNLDL
ncbi:hypothetical protein F5Y15DRAFT_417969 [Xylariaceae sp. FL0016]|nr:hypothetical protein F5Y15DRAFT_417969 [Xylariaceae sp. FL0016]